MTDDKDDKSLCMRGTLNHVEIQVRDLAPAIGEWGWLLEALGWVLYQRWDEGRSWKLGDTYIVVASARLDGSHDRRRPGLSHLAFHAGNRGEVDRLWQKGPSHGWKHLYEDRHPFAGGEGWYAAYMENSERFKIELVVDDVENDEVGDADIDGDADGANREARLPHDEAEPFSCEQDAAEYASRLALKASGEAQ